MQQQQQQINLGFWENGPLPLSKLNVKTYLSLGVKVWLKGGGGVQFPRNLMHHPPTHTPAPPFLNRIPLDEET